MIDAVEKGQHDSSLSINADHYVTIVGQAIGYEVAWPTDLISNKKTPQKASTPQNESVPRKAAHRSHGTEGERPRVITRTRLLGYPHEFDMLHNNKLAKRAVKLIATVCTGVSVPIVAYMRSQPLWITREDVKYLVHKEGELGAQNIAFYLRYIGEKYLGADPGVGASYSSISPIMDINFGQSDAVQTMVSQIKQFSKTDHLIFWPSNIGRHWVLVAINTRTLDVYYMDSMGTKMYELPRIKEFIETVIRVYQNDQGSRVSSVNWTNIEVPRQTDRWSCGYYVCFYIEDIIRSYMTTIPPDFVPQHHHLAA